jgi:hypothetical protein
VAQNNERTANRRDATYIVFILKLFFDGNEFFRKYIVSHHIPFCSSVFATVLYRCYVSNLK